MSRYPLSDDVEAGQDGTGRWFLRDHAANKVSFELYPALHVAMEASESEGVSWDDPADDINGSVATCIGCGCDDLHACRDGATGNPCCWIRLDRDSGLGVCSACPGHAERWDKGDREVPLP